ncbi:hypothetical protein VE03_04698 [Pseudogymnoascus sp. 23342-1-I1]|nr:hypothetical protein VE03_04698 [Pseudogymnoascus sp. 23342-1-I1]
MANTTDPPTTDPPAIAIDVEPSSTMETKTSPLTANVARILLLLRSLQRGRHNMDDPWIVLPLELHEFDDLFVRIGKNETLWGWVYDKLRFTYDSRTSTFVIRRPVRLHEAFQSQVDDWIQDKLKAIADSNAQSKPFVQDISCCRSATILIEPPGNERVVISHSPDSQFIYLDTGWPSVVLEAARSLGPKSLSGLARDYIVQSGGNIRAVVGFELDTESKKVSLTVWRAHCFIHPENGPTVGMRSTTQVIRDEHGTTNPDEGSGLRLMLWDFAPDFVPDLRTTADPHPSLLIDSAALCKFIAIMEESERKRAAGELVTSSRYKDCVKKRSVWPEPEEVYEEDGFVFGEEELSVHARFLGTPVDTRKVTEGDEKGDVGEVEK